MKVIFVCHGNICRSPLAEYVFADLVKKAGLRGRIEVSSAAASDESIGMDVYPATKKCLREHGIPCPPRVARKLTPKEAEECDLLLIMDRRNLRYLPWISPLAAKKAQFLGDYGLNGAEIEDPWYTGNFEGVYRQIAFCSRELLRVLTEKMVF